MFDNFTRYAFRFRPPYNAEASITATPTPARARGLQVDHSTETLIAVRLETNCSERQGWSQSCLRYYYAAANRRLRSLRCHRLSLNGTDIHEMRKSRI